MLEPFYAPGERAYQTAHKYPGIPIDVPVKVLEVREVNAYCNAYLVAYEPSPYNMGGTHAVLSESVMKKRS